MKIGAAEGMIVGLLVICASASSVGASAAAEKKLPQKTTQSSQTVTYQVWNDKLRGRSIPVKIYMDPKLSGPAPVVIFSHGLGGSVECGTYLGEYLSQKGYVCVHVQHPGSDADVWKSAASDGRTAILEKLKPAANGRNLIARIYDVKFVLDQLTDKNQNDPLLGNKLDLSRIAMAGHSFGAGTTLGVAGQNYVLGNRPINFKDPRIKAAVYLSPPATLMGREPAEVYDSVEVPGLLMTGTQDDSPIGSTTAAERVIPFQAIKASDQYLVNFNGGDHMIFSGRTKAQRSQSDEQYHRLISKVTGSFLDAYLKGDQNQKAWLKDGCGNFLGSAAAFDFK